MINQNSVRKTSIPVESLKTNLRVIAYNDAVFGARYKKIALLSSSIYTIVIDYPLEVPAKFTIRGQMTWEQLIGTICSLYHKIYNSDKYSIYGHGIEDLFIEKIDVNQYTKEVQIEIGS